MKFYWSHPQNLWDDPDAHVLGGILGRLASRVVYFVWRRRRKKYKREDQTLIMDDPHDDGGLTQEEVKERLAPWSEKEPSS